MLISVKKVDDKLHVTSPYNSTFVAKARKLGGKWEGKEWAFGGIPVATAWGRDSGAEVCDGVILSSGKITSGGSVANWRTYVADGSEFILTSIPKSIFERKERWAEYWEAVELHKPDKKAKEELEEELTRLEARIAEIKKELEALDA